MTFDPAFEQPDEFDLMTTGVPMVSPLQTMFAWATEHLRETCLDGFDVKDVGRLAYDSLPEGEREGAFGELLYTYWEATLADEETLAHAEQLRAQRAELRELLGRFHDLAESSQPVPYALLADIARLSLPLMGGAL
ncbi:hypothetical protein [Streptomyces sp. KN37]|uniref:hypothetical protein n=1 Tax=Streptomyces sp. KN37 TaxID=3090667 RepID=UPI002A766A02|nr:hypothetical protein [Streptomyces sp. KN37]WPO70260.1 hypothetical protein R9806_06255 [Streptomyces sp. KN37]WPO73972.1 hypothetical protein R9806_26820 [Streptomyces sp. KN37]